MNRIKSVVTRIAYGSALLIVALLVTAGTTSLPPYNQLAQSVVMLTNQEGTAGGTGFVIQANSGKPVTVTNWHVCLIADASQTIYAHQDGNYNFVPLRVQKLDAEHDLCILDAAPSPMLFTGKAPRKFTQLYVVGHPHLHRQTPISGHWVSEQTEQIPMPSDNGKCSADTQPLFTLFGIYCLRTLILQETTLIIYPGNSGSPVADDSGRVVGVVNSSDNETHHGGVVPLRFLVDLLRGF